MSTTNIISKVVLALCLALGAAGFVAANERINLNTTDAATLDRVMDGVGPAKAAAIIEHRRVHGPFRSVDQLIDVRGIGLATLERNRSRLVVGPAQAPAARPATATQATARRAPAPPAGTR